MGQMDEWNASAMVLSRHVRNAAFLAQSATLPKNAQHIAAAR
jgi:hypothetical protein